eukprot:gb/GECH01003391.1/.p1 GENE.gb/GECH01003391.1/~~gb/GECH01003391.1/.p1  ORF type:complete len:174 (+),score=56.63 gb/GECH01003391.1/:1-522(+)
MDPSQIEKLSKLLDQKDKNKEKANITGSENKVFQEEENQRKGKEKVKNNDSIWTEDELNSADISKGDDPDPRENPRYEILYSQDVASQDVYLGTDMMKDPSSRSCPLLIIRVEMPQCQNVNKISADVINNYLQVESPQYKLLLPMERKVDENSARAKWISNEKILQITVKIQE